MEWVAVLVAVKADIEGYLFASQACRALAGYASLGPWLDALDYVAARAPVSVAGKVREAYEALAGPSPNPSAALDAIDDALELAEELVVGPNLDALELAEYMAAMARWDLASLAACGEAAGATCAYLGVAGDYVMKIGGEQAYTVLSSACNEKTPINLAWVETVASYLRARYLDSLVQSAIARISLQARRRPLFPLAAGGER